MSPIAWAVRPLKRYADFSGRASRAEFWWFTLFVVAVFAVFWFVMVGMAGTVVASQAQPSAGLAGAFGVAGIFLFLFWIALFIPSLAVQVRRLHDTDRSGWWLGGFYLIYFGYAIVMFGTMSSMLGAAMGGNANPGAASGAMMGIAGVFGLLMFIYAIALLVFYCRRGTIGPNRFGDDPYGPDVAEVFG